MLGLGTSAKFDTTSQPFAAPRGLLLVLGGATYQNRSSGRARWGCDRLWQQRFEQSGRLLRKCRQPLSHQVQSQRAASGVLSRRYPMSNLWEQSMPLPKAHAAISNTASMRGHTGAWLL